MRHVFLPSHSTESGFGGRVFLWSPWLHRCSSGSLSLPLSLRLLYSQFSLFSCLQTRSTALPPLSWENRGRSQPVQSHNSLLLRTLWITQEAVSQCVPLALIHHLKWLKLTGGRGVKSHMQPDQRKCLLIFTEGTLIHDSVCVCVLPSRKDLTTSGTEKWNLCKWHKLQFLECLLRLHLICLKSIDV